MLSSWRRIARNVAVGVSLFYIALYLAVAVLRLTYPYEVEWIEGGVLDHVARLRAGHALYGKPSIDFTPFLYTPLYFYVSALASFVFGVAMLPLRLVSLLASLASFVLIFRLVQNETACRQCSIVAVGTFAACYGLVAAWYDQGRVDSLALALLLASAYRLRVAANSGTAASRGYAIAACWLVLAFLTKQTALAAAVPFAVYALYVSGWSGAGTFVGVFSLLAGCAIYGLDWASGGWFSFYVFELPARHHFIPALFATFWRSLLVPLALACLALVYVLIYLAPRSRPRRMREHPRFFFWGLLFTTLIGISLGGHLHLGGYVNVLMPACAALSLALGLGLHRSTCAGLDARDGAPSPTPRYATARSVIVTTLCVLQLVGLAWDPRNYLPDEPNRAAGNQLLGRVRATAGRVWLVNHGYIATLAGKDSYSHTLAMDDLRRGGVPQLARGLEEEIQQAVRAGHFESIIVGRAVRPKLAEALERSYRDVGPAMRNGARFGPVTGLREDLRLWVPRR